MIRPRWRKVISDLISNVTRSLLVIASISVGLFAVGLISTCYLIITQDMRDRLRGRPPGQYYRLDQLLDQDLVDHIRNVDGVRQAEGVCSLTLRRAIGQRRLEPIELQAIPEIADKQINQLMLEQGTWPPADKQIVVDGYKSNELPVGLGGSIEFELPSGKTRC